MAAAKAKYDAVPNELEKLVAKRKQLDNKKVLDVLNDYLSRTVDEGTKALTHLAFAAEAAELSAAYGDYGGNFYNILESSAEKFLDYAKLHPDFFSLHETEFENLISTADPLGYGVSDDLGYMMENVRIKLGYYNDSDEDK